MLACLLPGWTTQSSYTACIQLAPQAYFQLYMKEADIMVLAGSSARTGMCRFDHVAALQGKAAMTMLACFQAIYVLRLVSADLAREISKEIPDVKVDFLRASSYGSASESGGEVVVKGTSSLSKWDDYHILLVSCCYKGLLVVLIFKRSHCMHV